MRKTNRITTAQGLILAATCLLAAAGRSEGAGTVSVIFEPGTTRTIQSVSEASSTGATMGGMLVTAEGSGGGSETVTWVSLGGDAGQAAGTDWSLSESGNTWDQPWSLVNDTGSGLARVTLSALPGMTVFDTYFGNQFGTEGSARGTDFSVRSGLGDTDIVATYRDAVALTGDSPVGDLFSVLDIEFTNAGGLPSGSTLSFTTDTDNFVPEPATLVLLGVGAIGLARRRRDARAGGPGG